MQIANAMRTEEAESPGDRLARSACSEMAGPNHSIKGRSFGCPLFAVTSVGTATSQFAE